jgi:glutamine synthetase
MYEIELPEMKRLGLRVIPQSLSEAVDEFERDEVVQGALGSELAAEFISVKRREWARYHAAVGQWEVDEYLTLF